MMALYAKGRKARRVHIESVPKTLVLVKAVQAIKNPSVPKPYGKTQGFWQIFALLDYFRRQHFLNGSGYPGEASYTRALQLGISGFLAFNVLQPPADQNTRDAPPHLLGNDGHSEVGQCVDFEKRRLDCILVKVAVGGQLILFHTQEFAEINKAETHHEDVLQANAAGDGFVKGQRIF